MAAFHSQGDDLPDWLGGSDESSGEATTRLLSEDETGGGSDESAWHEQLTHPIFVLSLAASVVLSVQVRQQAEAPRTGTESPRPQ